MQNYAQAINNMPLLFRILLLIFLLFALLYVLTWTNTLKCAQIPGWCSVYYSIRGHPKVLIVYGDSGLGNPKLLKDLLARPYGLQIRASLLHIDNVSLGNLRDYDLVIVDHARKLSSKQIKMFFDYASTGGKLIWIADSGVEAYNGEEYLYEDDVSTDKNAKHKLISPWARKIGDTAIYFNKFLSVDYLGNFSDFFGKSSTEQFIGLIKPINRRNPFVYGISSTLKFYVSEDCDFAIVEPLNTGTSTIVASLDFSSNLYGGKIPKRIPLIVTNSRANLFGFRVSENVAYYAIPPECFASRKLAPEHRYLSFVDNMVSGMLYG